MTYKEFCHYLVCTRLLVYSFLVGNVHLEEGIMYAWRRKFYYTCGNWFIVLHFVCLS